ncbi:uncharacterized protein TNCV_4529041 [Trichonephila clavipes]|uniref:Uncharacterized protein n=1 Tax=Trichonephila clavipes TaxID=2585209 RepID=A0A8X6RXT1_TRICX|nr:uncharacterized protein TNCV_4529041 [Trichonephila clavipes]
MEAGWSARRVARQLGRYDCVVRRFRVMSFTLTPDSERPRQTNRREDCHIGRNACVQPTASSDAIQAQAERRFVLLARWIVRNVPFEIFGRSGHKKVPTSGKLDLQRPRRPCDESVRNISTDLLKRLFGKYKFTFIPNQHQKDERDIRIRSGGLDSGTQPINPEFRVGSNFRIILEQYLSMVENVVEFLEKIDNNLTYYEIPKKLACACLKGHLTRRVLDWFEVLGYRVVKDKATDYVHLKQALSEKFPVVRNRSELETRFYSSSQKHNKKPSDFVYDLFKIHKILKLEITEENPIDYIISKLEPHILDYVEVRHSQTTSNLLQIIDKYEERFLNRNIRVSSWES